MMVSVGSVARCLEQPVEAFQAGTGTGRGPAWRHPINVALQCGKHLAFGFEAWCVANQSLGPVQGVGFLIILRGIPSVAEPCSGRDSSKN